MNGLGLRAGIVVQHRNGQRFDVVGFTNKKRFRNPVLSSWDTGKTIANVRLEDYDIIPARDLKRELINKANNTYRYGYRISYYAVDKTSRHFPEVVIHFGTIRRVHSIFYTGLGDFDGFVEVLDESQCITHVQLSHVKTVSQV